MRDGHKSVFVGYHRELFSAKNEYKDEIHKSKKRLKITVWK